MPPASHKPPVALFDAACGPLAPARPRARTIRCRRRAKPASSIRRARLAGRRAASSRTATSSSPARWYATRGQPGCVPRRRRAHLQSAAGLSRQFVDRVVLGAMLPAEAARSSPTASIPTRWWREVARDRRHHRALSRRHRSAAARQPRSETNERHGVRFGIGAGVEPQLHAAFEQRFGFPLIEVWGMTEMVRVLVDNEPPRQVGTRAFGRPCQASRRAWSTTRPGRCGGAPGEMVIRHSAATPRRGFFSGYLKDDAATEEAWRGGWFHTGDTVGRTPTACCTSSTARRTSSAAPARTSPPPRSRPCCRRIRLVQAGRRARGAGRASRGGGVRLHRADDAMRREARRPTRCSRIASRELAYFKAPGWIQFVEACRRPARRRSRSIRFSPTESTPVVCRG